MISSLCCWFLSFLLTQSVTVVGTATFGNVTSPEFSGWQIGLCVLFGVTLISILAICTCCDDPPLNFRSSSSQSHARRPSDYGGLSPPTAESIAGGPFLSGNQGADSVTIEPLPDLSRLRLKSDPWLTAKPAGFNQAVNKGINCDHWFQTADGYFRTQLKYSKELGEGWFGKVVQGEASHIISGQSRTKVVCQILKEDANSMERNYFLHSASPFKSHQHANVLKLFAQCLDIQPFILIFEYCSSDLKEFLLSQRTKSDNLIQSGRLFRFCLDAAAGLRYLHDHNIVHNDLACRNCLVSNETVKIGDYGISFFKYKDEYILMGDTAVSIRWLAPECMEKSHDGHYSTKETSLVANVWTLGVVLWEVLEFGKLPYMQLTDEQVMERVLIEGSRQLEPPVTPMSHRDRIVDVMRRCWLVPNLRPSVGKIYEMLCWICNDHTEETDFDHRWIEAVTQPAQTSPVPSDPAITPLGPVVAITEATPTPPKMKQTVKFQEDEPIPLPASPSIIDSNQNPVLDDLKVADSDQPEERQEKEIQSFQETESDRNRKRESIQNISDEELAEMKSDDLVDYYEFLSMNEIRQLEDRHLAARCHKEANEKREKLRGMSNDQLLLLSPEDLTDLLTFVDRDEAEIVRAKIEQQINREKYANLLNQTNPELFTRLTAEDLEKAFDCLSDEEMSTLQRKIDSAVTSLAPPPSPKLTIQLDQRDAQTMEDRPTTSTPTFVKSKPPPLAFDELKLADNIPPLSSPALKSDYYKQREKVLSMTDAELKRIPLGQRGQQIFQFLNTEEIWDFEKRLAVLDARKKLKKPPNLLKLAFLNTSDISGLGSPALKEAYEERRKLILNISDDDLAKMPIGEIDSYYENMSADEIFSFKHRVDKLKKTGDTSFGKRRPLRSQLSVQSQSFLSSFGSFHEDYEFVDDFNVTSVWDARDILLDENSEKPLALGVEKIKEYYVYLTIEEIRDIEEQLDLAAESKKVELLSCPIAQLQQIDSVKLDSYLSWLSESDRQEIRARLTESDVAASGSESVSPESPPTRLMIGQNFKEGLRLTPQISPASEDDSPKEYTDTPEHS